MPTCPDCLALIPHHTNSRTSIGGSDRYIVWDLHQHPDGQLSECLDAAYYTAHDCDRAFYGFGTDLERYKAEIRLLRKERERLYQQLKASLLHTSFPMAFGGLSTHD